MAAHVTLVPVTAWRTFASAWRVATDFRNALSYPRPHDSHPLSWAGVGCPTTWRLL
jgi:hypothetical protein